MDSNRITMGASYDSYPHTEETHPLFVSKTMYTAINRAASDHLLLKIVKGEEVVLPSRLGTFRLFKHKRSKKKKHIDFKLTKEYGKTIYHTNLKTNGFYVRLHWTKKGQAANFKNKSVWAFKLTRPQLRYKENSLVKYINKHGVDHLIEK